VSGYLGEDRRARRHRQLHRPWAAEDQLLLQRQDPETIAWLKSMTMSGDLGDPVDVVPVMRLLVAPETRWVTAQTVYVNGGMISPIN
jgi:NAD(P)-dependent dehydrogenase (short-subunit alcohol dehydrogenase family)